MKIDLFEIVAAVTMVMAAFVIGTGTILLFISLQPPRLSDELLEQNERLKTAIIELKQCEWAEENGAPAILSPETVSVLLELNDELKEGQNE